MTLTIGSLFAGYGGLDLGIEAALDARTAWVSEIDPGACKVLAERFPHAPNLGDVTTIDWGTVPRVDIIAGGSPCQDLSTAGRRAGMTEGTRSNLWVAMREAIANVQPTFVVWENVRGAVSAEAASDLEHCAGCMGSPDDRGSVLRALGRVLGDLADLGFDAEVRGLRAADVGACHGRFRVFVLAWRRAAFTDTDHAGLQGHAGPARASQAERHGHAEPGAGRSDLAMLPTPRATDGSKGGPSQRGSKGDLMLPSAVHQLLPTPSANLGDNGGPQHPDKRRAGGHSVSIEDAVHGLAMLPAPRATRGGSSTETTALLPTPSVAMSEGGNEARGGKRGGELLLKGLAKYGHINPAFGKYAAAIARHEQALGRPAPAPTEPGHKGQQRLSARFVEWMQMLPAGWITDVPDVTRTQALKMLGNGVVAPQCAAALRDMLRTMGASA